LVDGVLSLLAFQADTWFGLGESPERRGNDHPVSSPYGTYKALDGYINIAPPGDAMWERLARALGLERLIHDPRFLTNGLRRENRAEIDRIINEITAKRTMADWIAELNQVGVPCGPIYNLAQAFADPQIRYQEMVLELDQPSGRVKTLGFPLKLSRTPAALHRPAPQLGQHTAEILANLGFSTAEIEAFKTQGVI
jgi:crotonobetainyl-CoA:carnitine CoA-transferase CaiB-like acyl-CoA transferase